MKNGNPKYSIVIPTRNRAEYLPFAVESVLSVKRTDIELIISNNYSGDGTASYLSGLSDSRLKVIMPAMELPMSKHYEYAISHATGEWVTILGDDDAIMPYLFDQLDCLEEKFPDVSIISSERAYYFWEGCEDLYGNVVVSYESNDKEELRSTQRDLFSALAGIRSCFNLPQIYTSCIAKRSIVEKIKADSGGYFFYSIIPDMYSVIALSLMESKYLRVGKPLFWTGTSNKSMSRSDRIYKDSKLQKNDVVIDSDNRVITLNGNVSQRLHGYGFSSLYLYEALLQCPLSSGVWRSKFIQTIVYASLKANAKSVAASAKVDKVYLMSEIDAEIRKNEGAPIFIRIALLLIFTIEIIQWILAWPARIKRRLLNTSEKHRIFSTNREDYPTIAEASKAVEILNMKLTNIELSRIKL